MAATAFSVRRHTYLDSVFLMRVAKRLEERPGVVSVAAVMGTAANKELLRAGGFSGREVDAAAGDDLVIAVAALDEAGATAAIATLDALLSATPEVTGKTVRTWDDAIAQLPNANLAVISIPGENAAAEVEHALERGLHVFCFSSNVALDDEIRLKKLAESRGLLLMGPDCGTSIIAGKGLGFSNVVRRGSIGLVGGSGTGLQAVSCLIDAAGCGVSHVIGCGSRDLSDDVGGVTTFAGFKALLDDAATSVVVIVSKSPGPATLTRLNRLMAGSSKPVVTCFLGGSYAGTASTFEDAATKAVRLTGVTPPSNGHVPVTAPRVVGRACGLFAGGSLRSEARRVLEAAGVDPGRYELVDLGSEELTRGRAHPMIDARQRAERIAATGGDAGVGLVLLDFVLGRGAAPDPAGDLVPSIEEARARAARSGRQLHFVASVVGTGGDPQDREAQIARLRDAEVTVLPTSAQAAAFVAEAMG